MKSYSILLMRRERIPALFPIVLCGALCLVFAAVWGAFWVNGKEASLFPEGVFLILFLFFTGLYLFSTDERRLIQKTLYGKTLLGYAEKSVPAGKIRETRQAVKALMDEIDGEAGRMLYACGGFALTDRWIILFDRPRAAKYLPGALTAMPIPGRLIKKISCEPLGTEENSGLLVRIWAEGNAAPHGIRTWDQKAIEALSRWSAALQERREV